MAGVNEGNLCRREILFERLSACGQEKGIVSTPDDQHRRLFLPKVFVPRRIGGDIGAVVVDEVQLDLILTGAGEISDVEFVAIRR
jgi:hypothetical protein